MCVLGASVDLYVVKKMGLNVSLAVSSASRLGASGNLYVVKNRVQESTICRDLGIVFGSLCRPVRRKKEGTNRIPGMGYLPYLPTLP